MSPRSRRRLIAASLLVTSVLVGVWSRQRYLNNELVEAVNAGDVPAARAALARGANPNARFFSPQNSLRFIRTPPGRWRENARLRLDRPEAVLRGATLSLKNPARSGSAPEMVALLLRHGAAPDEPGMYLFTPLHDAASSGDAPVVRALLDAGADPNARDYIGHTPLHDTPRLSPPVPSPNSGDPAQVVRLLVAHGARLEEPSHDGTTPLMAAVRSGHRGSFRALLESGASVHPARPGAFGPLHSAAEQGAPWMLRELLTRGADVQQAVSTGETPLLLLLRSYSNHIRSPAGAGARCDLHGSLRVLLTHGARMDVRDRWGKTPLDRARMSRDPLAVRLLEAAEKRRTRRP